VDDIALPGMTGNGAYGGGQKHDFVDLRSWNLRVTAICGVVNGWEPVAAEFLMQPGRGVRLRGPGCRVACRVVAPPIGSME
jgi:hypothetical protein